MSDNYWDELMGDAKEYVQELVDEVFDAAAPVRSYVMSQPMLKERWEDMAAQDSEALMGMLEGGNGRTR